MTVDAADQPVGAIARGELAGRDDVNYRTAHVFVFEGDALLLQELGPDQAGNANRLGSSVAAFVRPGESYRDAASRRAREELSIQAELDFVGKREMPDTGGVKHVALFAAVRPPRGIKILEPDHVSAVRWMQMFEVAERIAANRDQFTPTFVLLFTSFYPGGRARSTKSA